MELKRQKPILKKWETRKPTNDATKEQLEFLAKVNDYQYAYGCVAFGCDDEL